MVPWYETMQATMAALGGAALLLLSAIVIWPFAGWVTRRRGRSEKSVHPGRWLLVAGAGACIVFLVGFGWTFQQTDFQEFFKGVPPAIGVLLALPVIVIPLAVLAAYHAVRAWRNGFGSFIGRLHFSLVTAGLVAFLFLLNNWYMLGWRY